MGATCVPTPVQGLHSAMIEEKVVQAEGVFPSRGSFAICSLSAINRQVSSTSTTYCTAHSLLRPPSSVQIAYGSVRQVHIAPHPVLIEGKMPPLPKIGLPLATVTWTSDEIEAACAVIESQYTTMGDKVKGFEEGFAKYVGSQYAVMSNSGSSANLLAVAAMFYRKDQPLKAGDEVIVPTVSWSTTYFPLHQYGLKLVFVDIDPDTLNLDIAKVKAAVTPRTKLIMVAHLLGNGLDMDALAAVAPGIPIIEDTCESMGAKFPNGKFTGSVGVMGTFSTFFSHHISTMEGGLTVTDDEELYHILLSIRSHGWTRHLPEVNTLCKQAENPFYESYRFILPGFNVRPPEVCGAIGLHQLIKLPSLVAGRRKNAEVFIREATEKLVPLGVRLQKEVGESSWFCFAMTFPSTVVRDAVYHALKGVGVDSRPVCGGNFLRQPVVLNNLLDPYVLVGTDDVASTVTDCGMYIGNNGDDVIDKLPLVVDVIAETVKAALEQ